MTLVIRSRRVFLPEGSRPATVRIREGRIAAIGGYDDRPAGVREIDAGDLAVLPGLVDTHVHANDPGRTEWEGMGPATRAAAAGGVTTLVDMPLNSVPPTTSVRGLEAKIAAVFGRCHVDVGFWGGLIPDNAGEIEPLARAGVRGFKCFLSPSGVEEFPHVTGPELEAALPILARLGLPLLVHAELPGLLRAPDPHGDPGLYRTWLDSRPAGAEHAAIAFLGALASGAPAHIHIVHLASAGALPAIRSARAGGARLTVETCPHYLTFAAADVARGATAFKCAPPIREREDRDALWQALSDGTVDLIATDHSPAPPALKMIEEGDFVRAWGGIASLQLGLAAVWTGAAARGIPLDRIVDWMAAAPARLAGLNRVKGTIAPGRDADLVIWDPDAEAVVRPEALYHRHAVTPYAGLRLRGQVRSTLLRGEVIFHDGQIAGPARGQLLLRPFS